MVLRATDVFRTPLRLHRDVENIREVASAKLKLFCEPVRQNTIEVDQDTPPESCETLDEQNIGSRGARRRHALGEVCDQADLLVHGFESFEPVPRHAESFSRRSARAQVCREVLSLVGIKPVEPLRMEDGDQDGFRSRAAANVAAR